MVKRSLLILLALLGLGACGKLSGVDYRPDGPMAEGDMLVEGSIGDARTLNPYLASETTGADIAGMVFNGLLRYTPELKHEGCLAERWEVSKDGKVITYHLRKGVKFHDGVELSAEDVVFTYRCVTDPKTQTPAAAAYTDIAEVKALDRYTVRVTYRKVFAPALDNFSAILPKHLLEGKDINTADYNRAPIGTGPYRFVEWKTDQKIVLQAFDGYWEGPPHIKRFTLRIIPDRATNFLELLNGGLDAMGAWTRGVMSAEQYVRQTRGRKFTRHYDRYESDDLRYTYVGWNLRRPMFSDKRVRRALTMAMDRKALVDNVLYGLGRESTGPFYQGSWATDPEVQPIPYDPAGARRLLEEAGWKDTDGDGTLDKVLEGKKAPFHFILLINQGNDERARTATILQQQLKQVGVEVELRVVEWTTFLSQHIDKRDFDACILGWSLTLDPDVYAIWHSSQMGEHQLNHVSYSNPEVDRLLVEGRSTLEMAKRQAIYRKVHRLIHDDQPYTFLYVPYALSAVHKRFKGLTYHRFGGIGWHTERWYVPQAQQKYQHLP